MQYLLCCSNSTGATFDDLPLHPVRSKKQWLIVRFFTPLFGAPRRRPRRLNIGLPKNFQHELHVCADNLFSDCSPGLPPPVARQAPASERIRRSFGSFEAPKSEKLTRRSGLLALLLTKKRVRNVSRHALSGKSRHSSKINTGLPQGFKHVCHFGIDSIQNTTPYALASPDDDLYDSDSERWRKEFDAQLECVSPTLTVIGSTDKSLSSTLLGDPLSTLPTPKKSPVKRPGLPKSTSYHYIRRKPVPPPPALDRELPHLSEIIELHKPQPASSLPDADAPTPISKSQRNGIVVTTPRHPPFHNVKRKRVPSLAELDRRAAEGADLRRGLYPQKRLPLSPLPRPRAELPPSPVEDQLI